MKKKKAWVTWSSRFPKELARFVCFRFLKYKKARLKKKSVTVNHEPLVMK